VNKPRTRLLAGLAVAIIAGCGPSESSTQTASIAAQAAPPLDSASRIRNDTLRQRVWSLTQAGLALQDVATGESRVIALANWHWAQIEYGGCLPDVALGPRGEAVVTSNVTPTLWRVDPQTLLATEPRLPITTRKSASPVSCTPRSMTPISPSVPRTARSGASIRCCARRKRWHWRSHCAALVLWSCAPSCGARRASCAFACATQARPGMSSSRRTNAPHTCEVIRACARATVPISRSPAGNGGRYESRIHGAHAGADTGRGADATEQSLNWSL
jgi:hypothetical protein